MKSIRFSSGQTLIEFALVFPLILLLVVVFIDLGRIVYFHSALTNAAREGARYAIVHRFPTNSQRLSEVRQQVANYSVALVINPTDISVYCNRDTTQIPDFPCSDYVTVHASVVVKPMVPFMALIIGTGNNFTITAESTMHMTPYGSYK
jgi:Flp pilus assembly protein TadG